MESIPLHPRIEDSEEEDEEKGNEEGNMPKYIKLTKSGRKYKLPNSLRGKIGFFLTFYRMGRKSSTIKIALNQDSGKSMIRYLLRYLFMKEEKAGWLGLR